MAHAGEQSAEFAVSALMEFDLQHRAFALRADDVHLADVEFPIREVDALAELLEYLRRRFARDLDLIPAGDRKPRMGHAVGKFAVVGDQDQTPAAFVQSADGE